MTREQAVRAIETGATLAGQALEAGADLLATGEMGIGNTTVASAIAAALTGGTPERVTGRGTGVDDATLARKVAVVRRALEVNQPDAGDGLDVLAKVGGFEIGGLVGVILAGAARRVPVVLDGFIAGSAALIAVALAPAARHALFAAHRSAEPGHALVLDHLGLTPYLDLSLRLGEGTGAALFIHLARAAALVWSEMATFKAAGVSSAR
jgi:nicotinate-nucleotide--dimethylbenzimidazole phosphoribosyltransferase